jgi:hypothetical protein
MAKLTPKELLQRMVERYEELHFQNCVLQAAIIARNDPTLVKNCAIGALDLEARQIVREKFAPLREQVASLGDEMDPDELLAQIPPAPKVE